MKGFAAVQTAILTSAVIAYPSLQSLLKGESKVIFSNFNIIKLIVHFSKVFQFILFFQANIFY